MVVNCSGSLKYFGLHVCILFFRFSKTFLQKFGCARLKQCSGSLNLPPLQNISQISQQNQLQKPRSTNHYRYLHVVALSVLFKFINNRYLFGNNCSWFPNNHNLLPLNHFSIRSQHQTFDDYSFVCTHRCHGTTNHNTFNQVKPAK